MKKIIAFVGTLLSLCGLCIQANGQGIFNNEEDSTRHSTFLPIPALGYAKETGFQYGLVTLYSFYVDKQDTLTRTSTIAGVATFTTKKQATLQLKANIWSAGNKFHTVSEIKYKKFPYNFYGIGSKTLEADKDIINQNNFRLSEEVEKRIRPAYYFGLNASFDNYSFADKELGGIFTTGNYIQGREGGKVVFLGLSQIIDTRNSNIYTTQGTYIKFNFSYAPNFFGANNFTGNQFKLDFRTFKSFNSKTILGINTIYQTIGGNSSPFYLLSQLGGDEIMRGYYTGRYRDQNLFAAQAELRYRIIPLIGVVGFLGTGSVYHHNGFRFADFKPSYGAGLRAFFDVKRSQSLRLDYGIGEKRPGEKRQTGFYISLGEAF